MIGTAYYPDYYPEAWWSGDLDRMKRAGISVVRILEFAWCWYEPKPEAFQWQALERFLDLCATRQVEVCVCTPTATPPPWFFQAYPDCRLVDVEGRACFSHRHMVAWSHPEARAKALRTITALAEQVGSHPAVTRWQIDNESNYAEKVDVLYDFNPHTLRAAREWLRQKYGSLEALNDAWFGVFWSQAVNEWDQVWSTHTPNVNPQSSLDFHRWRQHTVAEFVQAQSALLRKLVPHASIGTNIPEVGVHFSTCIAQDYWAQGAGLDWVGTDLYAASGDREGDLSSLRYSCDLMRSAAGGARFLIAETQGGAHERTWKAGFAAEGWGADYLQQSIEVYQERGAAEIWAFMWRPTLAGQEMGMNGVQDLDGEDTDRTAVVADAAENAEAWRERVAEYGKRPRAVVHYSQDTLRFGAFFGTDQLMHLQKNLTGVHHQLDQQGFRIDFCTDADLLAFRIGEADLLVLPETQVMSDSLIEAVWEWKETHQDSTLLVGPHTGLLDERGHLRPPSRRVLQQRLGVTFGPLQDVRVSAHLGDLKLECFRELLPGDNPVVETLEWRGILFPARIQCGNALVISHPWGLHTALNPAHALPDTSGELSGNP